MKKIDAIKDGKGNIVISEDSFAMILACLDNQKFIGELPQNGDSLSIGENKYRNIQQETQDAIDYYNRQCRDILHQKYVLRTDSDGYFLAKKYERQSEDTDWTGEDVGLVYELFKDTRMIYKRPENLLPLDGSEQIKEDCDPIGKTEDGWIIVESEPEPWLIERPLRYDYRYLTISEDGKTNRPWKQDEIDKITKILNSEKSVGIKK